MVSFIAQNAGKAIRYFYREKLIDSEGMVKQLPAIKTLTDKPDHPCPVCGSDEWWLCELFGEPVWRCGRCHPDPRGEK